MGKSKMVRFADVIDRFLKIFQVFMIAFGIVSAIFVVLAFAVGEGIVQDASSIGFGNLTVFLFDGAVPDYGSLRRGIVISLAAVIVTAAAGWYLIRVIRDILKPMKNGRPFEKGVSSKIRRLAWTSLIGGALIEACGVIGEIAELKAYDISLLLNSEAVRSFDYNYSFNWDFALVAVILFFLSLVFRYGETLQQESDETL